MDNLHQDHTSKCEFKNYMKKFSDDYEPIEINTWHMLTDSFTAIICCPCTRCCCRGPSRRLKTLEMAQEKLDTELDVLELIKRVRESNDFFMNLLRKDQKQLLTYQKSWLIDVDESEICDSNSSTDSQDNASDDSNVAVVD